MNFFYYCISISCFSNLREFWGFNFQCMCIKIGTSIRGQTYECLCRLLCLQTFECISCQLLLLFFDQAASPTPIICFLTLLLPSAKVLPFVVMWFYSYLESYVILQMPVCNMLIIATLQIYIYIYIYNNPFSCLGLLAISFDCRENNPFCNTVQSLHTQTHPYVGTHAPLCNNIRTTCAYTHAHSPTHPYTHSCHTYTHTPLQQYMHHLCTPLHLLTNIYKY